VSDLSVKLQLLDPAESVTDISALDPRSYGLIVRSQGRQALLLPGIEGIETAAQCEYLKREGCTLGQGFLFSRPMAANALSQMIHTASPGAYTHRYARTIHAVSGADH